MKNLILLSIIAIVAVPAMAQRHSDIVYLNNLKKKQSSTVCIDKKHCIKEDTRVLPERK